MMEAARKILIVDDSRYMREYLHNLFSADERFRVIGTAADPYEAVKMMAREAPDAITLDIEMPRMSGVTFLNKIMRQHPLPVIVITNQDMKQMEWAMEALNAGAVDVVAKKDITPNEKEGRLALLDKVWAAANSRVSRKSTHPEREVGEASGSHKSGDVTSKDIILIGASSGGTRIITDIITALPEGIPPVVIVQHIPEHMSFLFARQLNLVCPFYVKEAEAGDRLVKNQVLIAPGNKHIEIKEAIPGFQVRLTHGPPLNHVRPSVDKLFFSALPYDVSGMTAILLTGMGRDGAQGLLQLREKGAYTIAQDEKSSIIYGMPRAAKELGAAKAIMNPEEIRQYIIARL